MTGDVLGVDLGVLVEQVGHSRDQLLVHPILTGGGAEVGELGHPDWIDVAEQGLLPFRPPDGRVPRSHRRRSGGLEDLETRRRRHHRVVNAARSLRRRGQGCGQG